MNVHFVLMARRVDISSSIRAAVNAVNYRLVADDNVYIYTNLCLDARDIALLHVELGCQICLQPLPCRDDDAISALVPLVIAKAKSHPDDANLLIDGSGKYKRSRTMIIPSISSTLKV